MIPLSLMNECEGHSCSNEWRAYMCGQMLPKTFSGTKVYHSPLISLRPLTCLEMYQEIMRVSSTATSRIYIYQRREASQISQEKKENKRNQGWSFSLILCRSVVVGVVVPSCSPFTSEEISLQLCVWFTGFLSTPLLFFPSSWLALSLSLLTFSLLSLSIERKRKSQQKCINCCNNIISQ